MDDLRIIIADIEKPDDINFILGQTHFIKSVEDIYEAMVNSVPNARFGIAFCEASGACKISLINYFFQRILLVSIASTENKHLSSESVSAV